MEKSFLQEITVRRNRSQEEETMYVCLRNVESSLVVCESNEIVGRMDRRIIDERIDRENLDDCREH